MSTKKKTSFAEKEALSYFLTGNQKQQEELYIKMYNTHGLASISLSEYLNQFKADSGVVLETTSAISGDITVYAFRNKVARYAYSQEGFVGRLKAGALNLLKNSKDIEDTRINAENIYFLSGASGKERVGMGITEAINHYFSIPAELVGPLHLALNEAEQDQLLSDIVAEFSKKNDIAIYFMDEEHADIQISDMLQIMDLYAKQTDKLIKIILAGARHVLVSTGDIEDPTMNIESIYASGTWLERSQA